MHIHKITEVKVVMLYLWGPSLTRLFISTCLTVSLCTYLNFTLNQGWAKTHRSICGIKFWSFHIVLIFRNSVAKINDDAIKKDKDQLLTDRLASQHCKTSLIMSWHLHTDSNATLCNLHPNSSPSNLKPKDTSKSKIQINISEKSEMLWRSVLSCSCFPGEHESIVGQRRPHSQSNTSLSY